MKALFICITIALNMAGLPGSVAHAEAPELIFHVPFDGSPDAQKCDGRAEPLTAANLSYAAGVSGQAVAISPTSLLEYAVDKNLVQQHGTVTLWFKPNWRAADMSSDAKDWHCLFYERLPDGKERIGSGALWFWFWGPVYRGDLSDAKDRYKTAGAQGIDPNTWSHLAFTWDINRGSRLYMNGIPVGAASDGDSPLSIKDGKEFAALANRFDSFYVGSQGGMARADGLIDEFKLYGRALSPAEIAADMASVSPLRLDCFSPCIMEAAPGTIRWRLTNASDKPADGSCTWKVTRTSGEVITQGQLSGETLSPGEHRELSAELPALSKGEYRLIVQPGRGSGKTASLWALGKSNPYLKASGKLTTTSVESIDFVKGVPPERFVVRGATRTAALNGREYYEAGPQKNDRFAVKVTLPEAGVPYRIEWDYPDDKLRTMEMVVQDAMDPSNDYALQTGVFCGGEYPNSMQTLTHRSILWARSRDIALIFMTARANAPAAVSALRIAKITGGLPDAGIEDAPPLGGWTRTVGIHFEDPSIGYDFGIPGQLMPQYEQTLDRLVAYMKYSGQNLLSYPAVWYHGRIGPAYQPRSHADDYIGCILAKFAPQGLGFMPAINLQNIELPDGLAISEKSVADGSLHSTPVMILASGKPNPGGWHGTPPNFNPLHPAVQAYVDQQVGDLLDRYGSSPAFKGVVLHLTKHTIPWFGSIEAGYNDYCIEAFEKDTSIRVAVDRKDPLRGKLYHDWLMANAREQWVSWRCRQIARWYRSIADRVSARRADLKLTICSYNPTISDQGDDKRYGRASFPLEVNRESGLDPSLYEDATNIILSQSIYPADYRWSGGEMGEVRNHARDDHSREGTYASIAHAQMPWINMHDRYFEDGIGGAPWWGKTDPLKADWLKETSWRVSALNPNPRYFLEHYILPLRYGDVLGYTKGGFLIGTTGVEEQLAGFSRAFRALPATRFSDVPGSTQTTKARMLKTPEGTWFYAVNTGREEVSVSFAFDRSPGSITDLAGAGTAAADGPRYTVQLGSYDLRSFRISGPASLVSVECSEKWQ